MRFRNWMMAGAGALAIGRTAAQQPNVLLILADDMGWGDVGFNGCKDIPTPHIDSIAQNGVIFDAGYVTAPQCGPSRTGLLSGRYQNRCGIEENHTIDEHGVPPGVRMFGEYMRDAGYRTGMVGKWHQGIGPGLHPLERGFDWFYGFLGGSSHYLPQGRAQSIPRIERNRNPQVVTDYLTFVFGERAIEFMRAESDKPFFLYLSFNAPHGPLQAPKQYLSRFEHLAGAVPPITRRGQTWENPRQIYAAMVSALDDTIGRVLQALREDGKEENTIIYFLSDNGGPTKVTSANNGPLRGVKGDVLEGGVRVPFAVQWKGTIAAGRRLDVPVSSLDLLPTSLAASGAAVPALLDGLNLLPVLQEGVALPKRTLLWRFPYPAEHHVWGIRQGEWKLVDEAVRASQGFTGKGITGLYRIHDDAGECNDLAAQFPEIRQRLLQTYQEGVSEWEQK
ncbi:MAG: sulfatase-like hydrolase/transferase [Kiritimatiellales bacterium]